MANLRVFISSTCKDLHQERLTLAKAVVDLGHSVLISEDAEKFPILPGLSTVDNCLEAINNHADFIILMIGNNYGSVDEENKSVTMKEYETAISLGIPIINFVKREVWNLYPIYLEDKSRLFSPIVQDNKVLEFIDLVASKQSSNWIFGFDSAEEVCEILKFQLSVFLRSHIPNRFGKSQVSYRSIITTNTVLNDQGYCLRSIDYTITNHSLKSRNTLIFGDHSELPVPKEDFHLNAIDSDGNSLKTEFIDIKPTYKRWEIFFAKPFCPGDTISFSVSYVSADTNGYLASHGAKVESGAIQYVLPKSKVKNELLVEVRSEDGWDKNPRGLFIDEHDNLFFIKYQHNFITSSFQFKISW